MLHSYLVKYADSLDSRRYKVHLKNDIDYSANHAFHSGAYWSTAWFADYWQKLFSAKLKRIGLSAAPGSQVLDCCCGRGYLGRVFEITFGTRTVYCDLSQLQLDDLIQTRRKGSDALPLTACAADILHLPYLAESFDYVVGNSFLHHIPDVPAVLGELYRVAKPKGIIAFFHEPTTMSTFWESFPLSLLKDTSPTDATGSFTDLWMFEPNGLARLMEEAGFESVRVFGSGILGAFFLNWYLILAAKLNWRSRLGVYPAYLLRIWLTQIDVWFQSAWKSRLSPSIMIVAQKPEDHRLW